MISDVRLVSDVEYQGASSVVVERGLKPPKSRNGWQRLGERVGRDRPGAFESHLMHTAHPAIVSAVWER